MLKTYGIELEAPSLTHTASDYAQEATKEKIKACFVKLSKIIVKNKLSLRKVFNDFDKKKKGYLTFE
jgi:hypothetical protein